MDPLYDDLNAKLAQFGMFHPLLSIDESMVPYYGRNSAKMFIRGKSIRFGFKLWSLRGSDGYPYHFRIYKGKETTRQALSLGTRVVNTMTDVIKTSSHVAKYEFYFDNLGKFVRSCSQRSHKGTRVYTGNAWECIHKI